MSKRPFAKVVGALLLGASTIAAFPNVGDSAKDFSIYRYDTKEQWKLADHIGKKVIVLISGSFC